jgi:glycosyltransferase involved in cell wall biosynthesis
MLDLIPSDVGISRTRVLDLDRVFAKLAKVRLSGVAKLCTLALPAMEPGWVPFAVRRGLELASDGSFDVIYSSSYPMSSHLVALLLKKRTGLPWVADYRDEWSIRRMLKWRTELHHWLARHLDRWFVRTADRVVTTSPEHSRRFRQTFGGESEKFVTVTNGYDEDDFRGPVPSRPSDLRGKFLISHVGSVFEWRNANAFLEAVRICIDGGVIPPDRLRVAFVGPNRTRLPRDLTERGNLVMPGYVAHSDAVAWMRFSDVLLLINSERTNIPAKTFEYLAAGNPILALVREGPTAELVREAGAGTVIGGEDVNSVSATLSDLYRKWERGELAKTASSPVVTRFSRRATTERLARVLQEAVGPEAAGDGLESSFGSRRSNALSGGER